MEREIEALRNVGLQVLDIVKRRDAKEMWDAAENLDEACETCHLEDRYPGQKTLMPKLDKRLQDLFGAPGLKPGAAGRPPPNRPGRSSPAAALPELPEVESVRRELEPAMAGARFVRVLLRRPDLRTAFPARFAARLTGRTVLGLDRRAKYLLAPLSSGDTLIMHLGMSGSFRIERSGVGKPVDAGRHDHVVFEMSSGRPSRSTIHDGSDSWTC